MSATYEITSDQDEIVIRLRREATDADSLGRLLDFLELESIRRRSQLSEADAADLMTEVKAGAWQQVRHLFKGS